MTFFGLLAAMWRSHHGQCARGIGQHGASRGASSFLWQQEEARCGLVSGAAGGCQT
jgi:hypothetical protein